jgi:hypothetical protein
MMYHNTYIYEQTTFFSTRFDVPNARYSGDCYCRSIASEIPRKTDKDRGHGQVCR